MNFSYLVLSPDGKLHPATDRTSLDHLLDALRIQYGEDAEFGIRAELQLPNTDRSKSA